MKHFNISYLHGKVRPKGGHTYVFTISTITQWTFFSHFLSHRCPRVAAPACAGPVCGVTGGPFDLRLRLRGLEQRRLKIQLDCETGAWTIRCPASRPEETKPSQQNKTGITGDGGGKIKHTYINKNELRYFSKTLFYRIFCHPKLCRVVLCHVFM